MALALSGIDDFNKLLVKLSALEKSLHPKIDLPRSHYVESIEEVRKYAAALNAEASKKRAELAKTNVEIGDIFNASYNASLVVSRIKTALDRINNEEAEA